MPEMKVGQRWMFQSSRFKYIIELTEINILNTEHLHRCKIVQSIKGGLTVKSETSIWDFKDLSNWTYLEGQDKPDDILVDVKVDMQPLPDTPSRQLKFKWTND